MAATAMDFAGGASQALGTNVLGFGVARVPEPPDPSLAYRLGQVTGDVGAMAIGAVEATLGAGGQVGSAALDLTGIGAAVGVPGHVVSAAVIGVGVAHVGAGTVHLSKHLDDVTRKLEATIVKENTPSKVDPAPSTQVEAKGTQAPAPPGSERWKGKVTKSGRPYEKPGPKTDPDAPHNAKVREVIEAEKAKGLEHVGGGDLTEVTVPTPGGKKPYRRMDATLREPATGETFHHNVGQQGKRGQFVKRERDAHQDVTTKARPEDTNLTLHAYDPKKR